MHYTLNESKIDLFLSWEETDGVLQAMTLNVTTYDVIESISLILSGMSLARENDMNNMFNTSFRMLSEVLVIFFVFGPPVSIVVILGSPTKYSTDTEREILMKKYLDVLNQFDEIKRSVKTQLLLSSLFGGVMGFVSFHYLILTEVENQVQLISMIILPFVAAIFIMIISEAHITMKFQDIDKKPNLLSMIPFIAFILGVGDYFMFLVMEASNLNQIGIILLFAICVAETVGLVYLFKVDKRLNKVKQDIESALNQESH